MIHIIDYDKIRQLINIMTKTWIMLYCSNNLKWNAKKEPNFMCVLLKDYVDWKSNGPLVTKINRNDNYMIHY